MVCHNLKAWRKIKLILPPPPECLMFFFFLFSFFFLLWNFILIQEQAGCLVLVHMTLLSFYLKHSSVSLLIYLCECFHHYLRFLCKRIFLISHYHLLGILKIFCIMPLSALSAFRPYSHSRTVGPGTRRCPRWLVGRTSKKKKIWTRHPSISSAICPSYR